MGERYLIQNRSPKACDFFMIIFTLSLKNLRGNFNGYTYFLADDEDTSDQAKPGPSSEQVIMNLIILLGALY